MSARVFHRIGMSEMRNIISAYENHVEISGSSASTPPESTDLDRVRRNLFGPIDREENRRFLERELALQQAGASDRWGFDFDKGTPRTSGLGTSRYQWEKVTPKEAVPEPYALLRMSALQNIAVDDESPEVEATAATPVVGIADERVEVEEDVARQSKRQSRITEYMQKRKLPYKNGSKSCPPEPATASTRSKKARTAPS